MRLALNMEDFDSKEMIREFNDGREENKTLLDLVEHVNPNKMSKKEKRKKEREYENMEKFDTLTEEDHGREGVDKAVSLGGRKRRKTRKKKRRKRTKKKKKKEEKKKKNA